MVETEEECQFCGGCEEVDVQLQAGGSDVVACPACMARDKNQAIARRDAEIERLRAAMQDASGAIDKMFWEGGIDQDDAHKLKSILHRESLAVEQTVKVTSEAKFSQQAKED